MLELFGLNHGQHRDSAARPLRPSRGEAKRLERFRSLVDDNQKLAKPLLAIRVFRLSHTQIGEAPATRMQDRRSFLNETFNRLLLSAGPQQTDDFVDFAQDRFGDRIGALRPIRENAVDKPGIFAEPAKLASDR